MPSPAVFQQVLRERFLAHQRENPRFSLRAFARRLGVSPGAVSELMSGKRVASERLVKKVADRLLLDPAEIASLLGPTEPRAIAGPEVLRLHADQFRLLADWEHLALLSLLRTKDFRSSPAWIAARLGISVPRVKAALGRLESLGLVARGPGGKLVRTTASISTSDNVRDLAVQKFHDEGLQLARESLHRDGVGERDFTAITFAVNPARMEAAKVLIRRFQDELAALLETGPRTEVYRFSTQLVPLTKPKAPEASQ